MKYIVVHKLKSGTGLSISKDGDVYNHEFTAWAIRSGKQVDYAYKRMARDLKDSHLLGPFSSMARYDLTYEELCAVIEDRIGPSDKQRYEDATAIQNHSVATNHASAEIAWAVAEGTSGLFWTILTKGAKFLLWMIITPFIIFFIKKPH